MNTTDLIKQEIKALSNVQTTEVLNFILFIKTRAQNSAVKENNKDDLSLLSDLDNDQNDELWDDE